MARPGAALTPLGLTANAVSYHGDGRRDRIWALHFTTAVLLYVCCAQRCQVGKQMQFLKESLYLHGTAISECRLAGLAPLLMYRLEIFGMSERSTRGPKLSTHVQRVSALKQAFYTAEFKNRPGFWTQQVCAP